MGRATTFMRYAVGDPGKHVQSHVPTPLWKQVTRKAAVEGVSIKGAIHLALREWVARG